MGPKPDRRAQWQRVWRVVGQVVLLWCAAFAVALLFASGTAQSQPATATPATAPEAMAPAWRESVRLFTLEAMQSQPVVRNATALKNTPAPRVHVEIGALDARLRLSPCTQVAPYLPPGARLSGATRIGLRCTEGPTAWNVSVPVRIQVFGRGLVAVSNVAAGAVLSAQDVAMGEVDLVIDASPAVLDPNALEGRTLARALALGQSVRQSHVKARQWFAVGDTVKVVASGSGFSVVSQGQALTPGIEGQPARVRTETGRIVSGMPVSDRQLMVDP
ncbi:MAG: flagellar basal body P-ring formation chaperone FlgA [Pseudomonadota bacterium]